MWLTASGKKERKEEMFLELFVAYNWSLILSVFSTDIQAFYEITLQNDDKSLQEKTSETLEVASRWEKRYSSTKALQVQLRNGLVYYLKEMKLYIYCCYIWLLFNFATETYKYINTLKNHGYLTDMKRCNIKTTGKKEKEEMFLDIYKLI